MFNPISQINQQNLQNPFYSLISTFFFLKNLLNGLWTRWIPVVTAVHDDIDASI